MNWIKDRFEFLFRSTRGARFAAWNVSSSMKIHQRFCKASTLMNFYAVNPVLEKGN